MKIQLFFAAHVKDLTIKITPFPGQTNPGRIKCNLNANSNAALAASN